MSKIFIPEQCKNWQEIVSIINNPNYLDENNYEPYDQALCIEELLNLEYYGHGARRVCFGLSDDKVLKIAMNKQGIEDNYKEFELWNNLSPELSKYFTKCYEVGDGYAVFQYINGFLTMEQIKEYVPFMTDILNKIKNNNIQLQDIGVDTAYRNWGLMDSIPMLWDYAS